MFGIQHHSLRHLLRSLSAILAGASLAWPAAGNADVLHLICQGGGSANKPSVTSGYLQDNQGNSVTGQTVTQRSMGFGDQVTLEIHDDGSGRIRMPRAMLPPLRGGKDGWFSLKDIKTTDSAITAVVQVNFINSPKLHLDRVQGSISLNGKAGDFFGTCQPFDPATVVRKF